MADREYSGETNPKYLKASLNLAYSRVSEALEKCEELAKHLRGQMLHELFNEMAEFTDHCNKASGLIRIQNLNSAVPLVTEVQIEAEQLLYKIYSEQERLKYESLFKDKKSSESLN